MTTRHSPEAKLRAQAAEMAVILKKAEAGTLPPGPLADKLAAKRKTDVDAVVGIAMDDKFISMRFPWEFIASATHEGLVEYIVSYMQEQRRDQ